MAQGNVAKSFKIFGATVALCCAASLANAKTIELGDLHAGGSYSFTDAVTFGESFTEYVGFNLDSTSQVRSFIKSFDMSIFSFDLLGVDNFSATLQDLGTGGFQNVASFTGSPISFDDLLGPGQYRIQLGGVGSGLFGGLFRGSLQVAAVPEADVWVMLLVGFVAVLHQLRRKQRVLEEQPVAA